MKMVLDSPERSYVAHLSVPGRYAEHIHLIHRAATHARVPCQEIAGATDTLASQLRAGLSVLILDYIPGQHVDEVFTVEQCRSFGRALAMLHNVRSPHWGSPALRLEARRFREQILVNWLVTQSAIAESAEFPWVIPAAELNDYLARESAFLASIAEFSMVHGDPHQANLVFSPTGEACWIDLDTAEYGLGAIELARVLLMPQCGLDPVRQRALLEGYWPHAPAGAREFWQEHAAIATVAAMLDLAALYIERAAKRRALRLYDKAADCEAIAKRLWQWRQHIVAAKAVEGTDWWRLVDAAPSHERLTQVSAQEMLKIRTDPEAVQPYSAHLDESEQWCL